MKQALCALMLRITTVAAVLGVIVLLVPTAARAETIALGHLRGRTPDSRTSMTRITDGDTATSEMWSPNAGDAIVWTLPAEVEVARFYRLMATSLRVDFLDASGHVVAVSNDSIDGTKDGLEDRTLSSPVMVKTVRIVPTVMASGLPVVELEMYGPVDATPPAAPAGLVATAGDGEVTLNWSANGEPDLAGYRVYQSLDGGSTWSMAAQLGTVTTYTATGLENGRSYSLAVAAYDTSGNESALSEPVTATPMAPDTTPPASPTGFKGEVGDGRVTVSWDPVADPDLSHYVVYLNSSTLATTTNTNHTIRGLTNGMTYQVGVSAVDTAGNESAAATLAVVPRIQTPLNLDLSLTQFAGYMADALVLYLPLWLVAAGLVLAGVVLDRLLIYAQRGRR